MPENHAKIAPVLGLFCASVSDPEMARTPHAAHPTTFVPENAATAPSTAPGS